MILFILFSLGLFVLAGGSVAPIGNKCVINQDCGAFRCRNFTCSECTTYESCDDMNENCFPKPYQFQNTTKNFHVCNAKSLFFPITYLEIIATFVCLVAGIVASSGGMGGSALHIPILLLVAQYSPKKAIPRSTAVILGTYLVNFINEFFYKHPKKNIPIVDYNVVLVIEPIMLLGTVVGVLLHRMCPDWFVLLCLVIILSAGSLRSFWKSVRMLIKENKQFKEEKLKKKREEAKIEAKINTAEPDLLGSPKEDVGAEKKSGKAQPKTIVDVTTDISNEKETKNERTMLIPSEGKKEKRKKLSFSKRCFLCYDGCRIQIIQKFFIFILWCLVLVFALLKGSSSVPSLIPNIEICSWQYWLLFGLPFPIFIAFTVGSGLVLHCVYRVKQSFVKEGDYFFVEGEMKWTICKSLVVPFVFFVAGIACGLLGIGGGVINSILLLEVGLSPDFTVATLSLLGFTTSSSTITQYFIEGLISYDYVLWYFGVGVLAAIVGRVIIGFFLRKMKRKSCIVFLISIVVVLSTLMLAVIGVKNIVYDITIHYYNHFLFTSPCIGGDD